jgi:transporter family-2 protein
MNSIWIFFFLAFVAGFCLPTQAGINTQLNQWSQSAILAATISFSVGTIGLIVYALCVRIPWPAVDTISSHPWWIWTGGLLGAYFVAATIVLAPKLGATSMIAMIIAGQLTTSVVIDHFGWLGYQMHPISGERILGVFLLLGGVVLVRLF